LVKSANYLKFHSTQSLQIVENVGEEWEESVVSLILIAILCIVNELCAIEHFQDINGLLEECLVFLNNSEYEKSLTLKVSFLFQNVYEIGATKHMNKILVVT
jgi:hypothetical protein